MEKQRYTAVKECAHGDTASRWQNWDENLAIRDSESMFWRWEAQALVSSNNIYINNNNKKTLFSNYDQNLVGITHNNEGYEGYSISGISISGVQMGIKHMPSPTNIFQKLQS